MWTWLASFIGGPIISGLINAYKAKLAAGNTADRIAADLAARELEVQAREVQADAQIRIAELGRWYEPDKLMGYAVALYFGKLLIFDKVFDLGSTDALCRVGQDCWTGWAANLIVMFYFGKRGIENVMRIWKR